MGNPTSTNTGTAGYLAVHVAGMYLADTLPEKGWQAPGQVL